MNQGFNPQSLTIDNALHGVRELLQDRIGPEIGDPFAAQMARLSCILLQICANGIDDAVELRSEENSAIRAILGEAAALVGEPLSDRLRGAACPVEPGLKISVLDRENDRLRRLLVDAQTALEGLQDTAARMLDQKIWCFLEVAEAKRAPRE